MSFEADVVVVGSGPGGATVARGLARGGRRVVLLEQASTTARGPGTERISAGCSTRSRRVPVRAREGSRRPPADGRRRDEHVLRLRSTPPPSGSRERYGIDLSPYVSETIAELGVAPLPAHLRGPASTRLAEAARALGYRSSRRRSSSALPVPGRLPSARRVHARVPVRGEVDRGRVRRRGGRGGCGAPDAGPCGAGPN